MGLFNSTQQVFLFSHRIVISTKIKNNEFLFEWMENSKMQKKKNIKIVVKEQERMKLIKTSSLILKQ